MLYNAKNGRVRFPDGVMEYVRFGTGKRQLVLLPGLGDSLRSMGGMALPMALLYRCFAKDFTVFVFGRKYPAPENANTREMARDVKRAMDALNIDRADLIGVSMGGMIAQFMAAKYPEKVNKLVLTVTCPCPNPTLEGAVGEWEALAGKGDHGAFMESNLRLIYSEDYYRKNRWTLPLVGALTKPKSYESFLRCAKACRTHNALDVLGRIQAPTLVIGGQRDNCLGGDASRLLAEKIPGAELFMYEQWGHGLYEEAKDFNPRILEFLLG